MRLKIVLALCPLLFMFAVGCRSPESKLVALFFDDAFYNQYEVALPVLVKYGFRATFGVITNNIGEGQDQWQYMGEKELKELAEWGMDIASHTRTHPHLVKELSDQELRSEIIDSKRDLEKMGFNVRTMVYPYYEYNERVIEYVREAGYVCARAGWPEDGTFDLTSTDPNARYHISSTQISIQYAKNFQRSLDKAGRNSLVCLVYHLIDDDGPESTATTVADFNAQMAYLYDNGFTVVLLPELFQN